MWRTCNRACKWNLTLSRRFLLPRELTKTAILLRNWSGYAILEPTALFIYLFIYLFWLVMDRYAILESFWFRTSYLQFRTSDFGLRTSHSQPYPTSINFICGSLEPWVWSRVGFIYWWTYRHRKGRCYYSWLIFYFAQLNAMYHTISVANSAVRISKLRNILASS